MPINNTTVFENVSDAVEQSNSLPQCSFDDPYPTVQIYIRLYASTPILLIGIVGNALNIAVYSIPRWRAVPMNKCLLVLSTSDFMLMMTGMLMFAMPVLAEQVDGYWSGMARMYRLMTIIEFMIRWTFPISQMSATWGVYLTILISGYQCIVLKHRYFAKKYLTPVFINWCLIGIIVCGILFNLNRFFELRITPCHSHVFNVTLEHLTPGPIMMNHAYYMTYHIYLTAIILVTIPICTLIPFNCFFVKFLYDSQQVRKPLMLITEMTVSLTAKSALTDNLMRKAARPSFDEEEEQAAAAETVKLSRQNTQKRRVNFMTSGSSDAVDAQNIGNDNNNSGSTTLLNVNGHLCSPSRQRIELKPNSSTNSLRRISENPAQTSNGLLSARNSPRNKSTKKKEEKEESKEDQIKVTIMVAAVSVEFLVCNLLTFANNIIEVMAQHNDNARTFMYSQKYTIMVEVGNLLVTLNAATTFLIYMACNAKFRRALVDRLKRPPRPPKWYDVWFQGFKDLPPPPRVDSEPSGEVESPECPAPAPAPEPRPKDTIDLQENRVFVEKSVAV